MRQDEKIYRKFVEDNFPNHTDLEIPEKTPGADREIDATFTSNGTKYALEHTRIVRFEHEARSNAQFKKMRDQLHTQVKPILGLPISAWLPCRNYGDQENQRRIVKTVSEILAESTPSIDELKILEIPLEGQDIFLRVYWRKQDGEGFRFRQLNPEGKVQFPNTARKIEEKLGKLAPYKVKGFRILLLTETLARDAHPHPVIGPLLTFERTKGIALDELWEVQPASNFSRYTSYELDSFRRIPQEHL